MWAVLCRNDELHTLSDELGHKFAIGRCSDSCQWICLGKPHQAFKRTLIIFQPGYLLTRKFLCKKTPKLHALNVFTVWLIARFYRIRKHVVYVKNSEQWCKTMFCLILIQSYLMDLSIVKYKHQWWNRLWHMPIKILNLYTTSR